MDIHQDEHEDFKHILNQYDHRERDFQLSTRRVIDYHADREQPPSTYREITVKRRSTNKVKTYRDRGHAVFWLSAFKQDLRKGEFNS
jgi:hypothetical protein